MSGGWLKTTDADEERSCPVREGLFGLHKQSQIRGEGPRKTSTNPDPVSLGWWWTTEWTKARKGEGQRTGVMTWQRGNRNHRVIKASYLNWDVTGNCCLRALWPLCHFNYLWQADSIAINIHLTLSHHTKSCPASLVILNNNVWVTNYTVFI